MKKMTRFLTFAFMISAVRPSMAMDSGVTVIKQPEAMLIAGLTGVVVGGVTYWFMEETDTDKKNTGYKVLKFIVPVSVGGLSAYGMYKGLQSWSPAGWLHHAQQQVKGVKSVREEFGLKAGQAPDIDALVKKMREDGADADSAQDFSLVHGVKNLKGALVATKKVDAVLKAVAESDPDTYELVKKLQATAKAEDAVVRQAVNGVQVRSDYKEQSAAYAEEVRRKAELAQRAKEHADNVYLKQQEVRARQDLAGAAWQTAHVKTAKENRRRNY